MNFISSSGLPCGSGGTFGGPAASCSATAPRLPGHGRRDRCDDHESDQNDGRDERRSRKGLEHDCLNEGKMSKLTPKIVTGYTVPGQLKR